MKQTALTLQDDEDEDFPESVYTLKDGSLAKSTMVALHTLGVGNVLYFLVGHGIIRCVRSISEHRDHRGTFDDFLKGHERVLVEFYAPPPED